MTTKMSKILKCLTPPNFLCYYSLSIGSIVAGLILILVSVICIIALLIQIVSMQNEECTRYIWKNAFSFSATYVIYNVVMVIIHALMIWGVTQEMASIMLAWFVLTTLWLAQTFFLMVILLVTLKVEVNFVAWIISLIFGVASTGILIYLILVICGYWLELKAKRHHSTEREQP